MNCPKCNTTLSVQAGELHGLNHDQMVCVCAFNPDCDFGLGDTWQIFSRDDDERLDKMLCSCCGLECQKDPSDLCLHCFCETRNLECQCGCVQAQDENFLEKISVEKST